MFLVLFTVSLGPNNATISNAASRMDSIIRTHTDSDAPAELSVVYRTPIFLYLRPAQKA